MTPPAFQIRQLSCAYRPDREVLRIDRLTIPAGRLTFIVGVSGGGKSTLVETLGLMNHTTGHPGSSGEVLYAGGGSSPTDLLRLWSASDEALSTFRRRRFSFIFQRTNLMENFSAGENILLPALLAGRPRREAKDEVLRLLHRLDLPEGTFDAPVTELSGGQRQRLAFIRALVADYEVLFGDEPTGNLDAVTAHTCLEVLKEEVTRSGKTALIVSHDLTLATTFGDEIVPITTETTTTGQARGTTGDDARLSRNSVGVWTDATGTPVEFPGKYLSGMLVPVGI